LEALGRRDIKVYSGAAKPIVRDAVHAADIHGESGLDGVTLLPQPVEPAATDVDHLEAMYRALIATPANTAWLVSTGTLTNIGLLFQKYPNLAGHIKGLSIMGGAVGNKFTDAPMGKVKGEGERFGNWTAYAEFNVRDKSQKKEQSLTTRRSTAIPRHPTLSSRTQFFGPRQL
jgi:uridine nucleosidase